MTLVAFVLGFLLTLRLTRLVTTDKITSPLRDRLSLWLSPYRHGIYNPTTRGMDAKPATPLSRAASFGSELVDCDWCTSLWIAAAVSPIAYNFPTNPAFILISTAAGFSWLTGFATTVNDAQETRANY